MDGEVVRALVEGTVGVGFVMAAVELGLGFLRRGGAADRDGGDE